MMRVDKNMGSDCAISKKLNEIAKPKIVECDIAAPIKAFLRAMISGEISPHVNDKKIVPIRA
jgi:ribosomal protein S3AE